MKSYFFLLVLSFSASVMFGQTGNPFQLPQKFDRTLYVTADNTVSEVKSSTRIQDAFMIALKNRAAGKSTRIILRDGIYREVINLTDKPGTPDIPILMEAEHSGKAIITGSHQLYDWQAGTNIEWHPLTSVANIYATKLPLELKDKLTFFREKKKTYRDGKVPNPWEGHLRDEKGVFCNGMLRMDGRYFWPVDSLHKLVPGSFTIDYDKNMIYLKVKSRLHDPSSAELAVEPFVFKLANTHHIALRGLVIQHAGWALQPGAILENINFLLVENCSFNNNRYEGLSTHKIQHALFKNVEASSNGGKGMSGSWEGYIRNTIFEGLKVNYNNWIGVQMDFTGWDPCGVKWSALRDVIIRNSEFVGNYATGLWLDTENRRIQLNNLHIRDNLSTGLYLEANVGPITVRNTIIRGNLRGLLLACSEDVTFFHTQFLDNENQVQAYDNFLKGRGPSQFQYDFKNMDDGSGWETHSVRTSFQHCVFKNRPGSNTAFFAPIHNDGDGFMVFIKNMRSANNTFYHNLPKPFFYKDTFFTLREWQQARGLEMGSKLKTTYLTNSKIPG